LPQVVKSLNPADLSGTLVLVPLMNTSGFEFEQVNAAWDNKDLNTLGRGRADGTVSEQMIYHYYQEVISKADALLDIRTGAQWSYHRYAGVYKTGEEETSRQLAMALGLDQVLLGQPVDSSSAFCAAEDGKQVVSAWLGGGPGLRDHRTETLSRIENAVLNAMKHLGMLAGQPEYESSSISVIDAHTVLKPTGERGFVFMDAAKRGKSVAAGEQIGIVRHPFEGKVIEEIKAPKAGIMLHAGGSWPVLPEDTTLAILGDLVEEVNV
ncbi:MAG: succinylglutamate desuccinylase/aspartoacylase family protein, partial [Deinococcota bacterium]